MDTNTIKTFIAPWLISFIRHILAISAAKLGLTLDVAQLESASSILTTLALAALFALFSAFQNRKALQTVPAGVVAISKQVKLPPYLDGATYVYQPGERVAPPRGGSDGAA